MKRKIIDFFQQNPFLESIFQVLLTIAATFLPILAVAHVHAKPDNNGDLSVIRDFLLYFQSGEISLTILTIAGSILFLIFTKFNKLHPAIGFLFYIAVPGSIIYTSVIIGSNPGFMNELPIRLTGLLWAMYIVVNIVWLLLIYKSSSEPPSGLPRADKEKAAAQKLAEEARG